MDIFIMLYIYILIIMYILK